MLSADIQSMCNYGLVLAPEDITSTPSVWNESMLFYASFVHIDWATLE